MTDPEAILQKYLVGVAALRILVGNRVYAGQNLPGTMDGVQKLPAILFTPRGGSQDFSSKLFMPSFQFRCFAETERQARELNRALYDALNDHVGDGVVWARMEDGTFPTLLTDPDTNWPYMLSFYKVFVTNGG